MIYDITPPVRPGIPVWPGDSAYSVEPMLRRAAGDSVNVARLVLSAHTGAHADAFYHCSDEGAGMGETPLEAYLGRARVLDAPGNEVIDAARLERLPWRGSKRLLFRTRPGPVADPYATPFAHFAPNAIEAMATEGVVLVGIDTPSMDAFTSKTLDSHHALMKHRIANLENLDLLAVPPGDYELIALPLKLMGVDGSPVRAILRAL